MFTYDFFNEDKNTNKLDNIGLIVYNFYGGDRYGKDQKI